MNSMELDSIRFSYDSSNGAIRITSQDPRLAGKPFRLTVTGDSDTYKTLFKLLEDQGLIRPSQVSIPTSDRAESAASFLVPGADPRLALRLGTGFEDRPLILDLSKAAHTLIAGAAGFGKSVLQRSVVAHALVHEEIKLYGVDLMRMELGAYPLRPQDKLATTLAQIKKLLDELHEETMERYSSMEAARASSYLELTDVPAIYLMIDELAYILSPSGIKSEEGRANDELVESIRAQFSALVRFGRTAGVYIFAATKRPSADILSSELKSLFGNRILMGRADANASQIVLGEPARYGGALLQHRGRGVAKLNGGEQRLFQAAFISPSALVTSYSDSI